MVKGDWPDDFLDARVARCVARKCVDVVALVDGVCWFVDFEPIDMARANTGDSVILEHLC